MSYIGSNAEPLIPEINVALLTGNGESHYCFSLALALAAKGVRTELVGGTLHDRPEIHRTPGLRFINLFESDQRSIAGKIRRVLRSYVRLVKYAAVAKPAILHILWDYKVPLVDRTLLMLYYKLLGKRIAYTAHNVNAARRDNKDSLMNRLTLRFQYRLADHIFVHTEKMKDELHKDFQVRETAVTVIPHGVNTAVPQTGLTSEDARQRLGIKHNDKMILFFGGIKAYKGLEDLLAAFQQVAGTFANSGLIIAGQAQGHEGYMGLIQNLIDKHPGRDRIIQRIGYIPDDEIELYFKAADVAVLPYVDIFQSGVLLLAYTFGLPVIVTDVGSLREDIIEGRTGFVCRPRDPDELCATIERYFNSMLFKELDSRRNEIRDYALSKYSWRTVSELTKNVYEQILANSAQPIRQQNGQNV